MKIVLMRCLLTLICCAFVVNIESQSQFPKDATAMGLKGKVKTMKQVSLNKGIRSYQLDETFFFDEEGTLVKIEHHTLPQANIEKKSMGKVTVYVQESGTSRMAITFGETKKDTVKIQTIKLVNSNTIDFVVKELWNKDLQTETTQRLDVLNRLAKATSIVYRGKSKRKWFDYSYQFIYKNGLVVEVINKNNGQENRIKIINEKIDDYGNPTSRKHVDKNGITIYTEEREFEYYEK